MKSKIILSTVILSFCITGHSEGPRGKALAWAQRKQTLQAISSYYEGYAINDLSKASLSTNLVFKDPMHQTYSRAEFLAMVRPVYQIFRDIKNFQIYFEDDTHVVVNYDFIVATCPDREVAAPMDEQITVVGSEVHEINLKFDPKKMFPCGLPR